MTDPNPLTGMDARTLDEFAAWAHAAEGTPGVEIVEILPDGPDDNGIHGHNDPDEMTV